MEEQIAKCLRENQKIFEELFKDCADIKLRKMYLGREMNHGCLVVFNENATENMTLERSVVGKLINYLCQIPGDKIVEVIDKNAFGVTDVKPLLTIDEAVLALLTGNSVLFIDGYEKALKIADKGYPGRSVTETDSEKVSRGSNEGFSESVKVNTALVRKRIRSPRMKVKEKVLGLRSHTTVSIIYMEDVIEKEVLENIEEKLDTFEIDGILDSGIIEQLTEEKWYSPFPQFQSTRRPDRAAMAILEGRVVVLSDNSPEALILPTDLSSFIQTTDDYYTRTEVAVFERLIRYGALLIAALFPGFYLAVTGFHTQLLPTSLLLSFVAARQGVPFNGFTELLIMELAFELLREAGIRVPGNMGNAIGIVGGLIVGQAAVDANLVSPIVVIVVALTALCSFAIPNEEFAASMRVVKFGFLILCAFFGLFGFIMGVLFVLLHLASLKSFGVPYLSPLIRARNQDGAKGYGIFRFPIYDMKKRPVYSNGQEKIRLRRKEMWKRKK